VGGQTRLISVPRGASFGELLRKVEKVEAVDEAAASGSGAGSHQLANAAVDESGQRYIDAINCVSAEVVAAAMHRKDSVASAGSSAHSSEASEYNGLVEGMSPRAVPASASA
jgi:hypothetical protein